MLIAQKSCFLKYGEIVRINSALFRSSIVRILLFPCSYFMRPLFITANFISGDRLEYYNTVLRPFSLAALIPLMFVHFGGSSCTRCMKRRITLIFNFSQPCIDALLAETLIFEDTKRVGFTLIFVACVVGLYGDF